MRLEKKRIDVHCDIKAFGEPENGIGKIKGYGSVFGVIDSYNEVCDPGCFKESLKEYGLPAMLIQHSPYDVGGVWKKAEENDNGLIMEGELNLDVQKSREAYSLVKQGALKGLSIGFRTMDAYYDDANVRHLKQVRLLEVSLVTFPANQAAQITSVKFDKNDKIILAGAPKTERELEEFLRDAGGYSRNDAKSIVSHGFKGMALQRDVGTGELKTALENALKLLKGN